MVDRETEKAVTGDEIRTTKNKCERGDKDTRQHFHEHRLVLESILPTNEVIQADARRSSVKRFIRKMGFVIKRKTIAFFLQAW